MVPFGFVENAKMQTSACSLQQDQARRASKDGGRNLQQDELNFPSSNEEGRNDCLHRQSRLSRPQARSAAAATQVGQARLAAVLVAEMTRAATSAVATTVPAVATVPHLSIQPLDVLHLVGCAIAMAPHCRCHGAISSLVFWASTRRRTSPTRPLIL